MRGREGEKERENGREGGRRREREREMRAHLAVIRHAAMACNSIASNRWLVRAVFFPIPPAA